jgi:hypothetical protein
MSGFVEIPGFAEAVKHEQQVRRQAFAGVPVRICGVLVRDLTLRDLEVLEELENGFFCPWRFDTDFEFLAHCAQLVWYLSDCPKPKGDSPLSWGYIVANAERKKLNLRLARHPDRLAKDTTAYLKRQFMDAPKGQTGHVAQCATAAGVAYILDALAAGGYAADIDRLMAMPLPQVWQLVRLVQRRVFGQTLTNPSDKLATDYLAQMAHQKQGNN